MDLIFFIASKQKGKCFFYKENEGKKNVTNKKCHGEIQK